MRSPADLRVGLQVGAFTLLADIYRISDRGRRWICRCRCGVVRELRATDIVRLADCGCGSPQRKAAGNAARSARAAHRHAHEAVQVEEKRKAYAHRAKNRGHSFELSPSQFADLVLSPCKYCGTEEGLNGIDRMDSAIGYTVENSAPCCRACNIMKNVMGVDEFLDHIDRIVNHQIAQVVEREDLALW